MGYSKDFRERAVAYKNEGHTIEETSKVFAIGKSTLNQWLKNTGKQEIYQINLSTEDIKK